MTSVAKKIDDGLVSSVRLVEIKPFYLRFDVFPFTILYLILFLIASQEDDDVTSSSGGIPNNGSRSESSSKILAMILIPCSLVLHLVLFLLSQWMVNLRCFLGYADTATGSSSNCFAHCTHVLVKAAKNVGEDRIVPLVHTHQPANSSSSAVQTTIPQTSQEFALSTFKFQLYGSYFEFQKVKYSFDSDKNSFVKLDYISSGIVSDFLKISGLETENSVRLAYQKWGLNLFEIPIPEFLDLYLEHLVAPFFVFQVICLVLWSLDDYWYYSAMTLCMLMFFEGMLCNQRLQSLQMLRGMRRADVDLLIYRCNKWLICRSNQLLPGDILSLSSLQPESNNGGDNHELVMPCDALVVRGHCVMNEAMLTGESVPQMKESLKSFNDHQKFLDLGSESSIDETWRRFMVFGGTSMLQNKDDGGGGDSGSKVPNAPGGGCLAVVVRTGFGTSQGGMMRKILFAKERVSTTSYETFYFIGVLVVFAVAASAVVLYNGLEDSSRNKFKLVLHCIMIVTSVVPPELPMELSLAVTNSLAALQRQLVFCTEPFRIASAGKLDVLCFDKTGTLTKDKMYLKGVVLPHQEETPQLATGGATTTMPNAADGTIIVDVPSCSPLVLSIMASCHSLFLSSGKICGDPLEIVTMEATGYSINEFSNTIEMPNNSGTISVRQKYPFSSSLKRMSVLVASSVHGNKLFMKGAPEIISALLATVPENYVSTYTYHMSKGKRVLALAYKDIATSSSSSLQVWKREEVEKDVKFAGFLIFDCDLKPDSKSVMKELVAAEHKVVMITGDSPHTASEVARRVGMFSYPKNLSPSSGNEKKHKVLMLHVQHDPNSNAEHIIWKRIDAAATSTDESISFNSSLPSLIDLYQTYRLCVTGGALLWLQRIYSSSSEGGAATAVITKAGVVLAQKTWLVLLKELSPYVTVFARVSPNQKEEIIIALNSSKCITLMTGDGTNDVGALKAAHVGVSIVNDPEFENRIEGGVKGDKKKSAKKAPVNAKDRMDRALAELREQDMDPTIVKLGDASIASPFTSRRTSIDAVLSVIRQGRATLVTIVQIYKILALNCLVSAYMMSVLYLRGLKQGDVQMTVNGLVTAFLFFFLSQAKPLPRISEKRPAKSVFSKCVIFSIFGQFVVHIVCLISLLMLCQRYSPKEEDSFLNSPDGRFQPTLINSAVFLLSMVMQINNFVVNYRGAPFTQDIQDNTTLWRSVQILYASVAIATAGVLEPLNDLLQLAPFPAETPEFKSYLMMILVANFAAAYGIERMCRKLE